MRKAILAGSVSATLTLLVWSSNALAFPATDTELALVPGYCKDTQGFGYGDATTNTSPKAGHWVSLMGKTFWHMHHYCRGLIKRNRAMKAGMPFSHRRDLIRSALGEYEYVLANNKDADFILLPEIYTRVGEANVLIGDASAAEQAFAKARQLKPDYWPAYSHWAEYLIQKGKRAEAKQLVKSGLEQTPTAKVLIDQYRQLGGKPSEIVPIVKKPVNEEDAEETGSTVKPDDSTEKAAEKSRSTSPSKEPATSEAQPAAK